LAAHGYSSQQQCGWENSRNAPHSSLVHRCRKAIRHIAPLPFFAARETERQFKLRPLKSTAIRHVGGCLLLYLYVRKSGEESIIAPQHANRSSKPDRVCVQSRSAWGAYVET
jgi:hypothetical protein